MTTEKPLPLRKALEELERIVAAFEGGEIDLERDLPKFERGLALATACRERLKDLENHIRRVEKTFHVTDASDSRRADA